MDRVDPEIYDKFDSAILLSQNLSMCLLLSFLIPQKLQISSSSTIVIKEIEKTSQV